MERGEKGAADAVKAEQINTIFRQNPWVIGFSPLDSIIVAAVLWTVGWRAVIVAWVGATTAVTVARAFLRRRFLAEKAPDIDTWARRFVIGAASQGLLWGIGSVLLLGVRGGETQLILIFVVAGLAAGGAGTLATYLPACFSFMLSALIPLALRFFAAADGMHLAMGVLCCLYAAALCAVAINTNRAVSASFRLRFEKDSLLARLSRTQASLEETNRELEQRVEARSLELKQQDEALQEARRLESIGLLAGGIAHDFNNLLTVILGNAALLQDDPAFAGAQAADGPVGEIRGAAERAASLVSQLLASSRRQPREVRVLDLNAAVSDGHRLLSRLIGEHIEIEVSLRAGPLPVAADRGQLEQVIVNLATNARDAMPGGGRLTLETELLEVPSGGAPVAPGLPPGPYAVLAVRDTGVGMDPETMRMAFHPFFTTKEVGRGTGLGLATVNGIVEQSGGRVFVESVPGKGSCFRVFLPRAEAPPLEEQAAPAAPARARAAATALLVEDEPLVRGVISRALVGAGFTVLEASNGEQALELARGYAPSIDLLITDVVMARMGGLALAQRLRVERPGLAVLFISGYSADADVLPPPDMAVSDYLAKPFTATAMLERVVRLLEPARPAITPRPAAVREDSGKLRG